MAKPSKSKSSFRVEGLEPRILLSAVPLDGAVDPVEDPLVLDSVGTLDSDTSTETSNASGAAGEGGGVYEAATSLPSDEVYLSGEVASGTVINAAVIHIADGTILDGVRLTASSVELGAAVWSGDSEIYADVLDINADQASEAGAVLTLGTRYTNATIALGFDDEGFALSTQEIDRLAAAGLDELIIGLEDGSHDVTIDGLAYSGDLRLRSPRDGGEFYILSQIQHSGGTLRYEGSGQTQNASADTVTSGNDILVDDTLQLVYTENTTPATNQFGDNTFYFDTTNDGNSPEGADILISGDILGTSFDDGGTLYLNAGTTGNILIQGDVGTIGALGRIVIVNANNVTFQGDIILESFEQTAGEGSSIFGSTSSNFFRTQDGNLDVTTEKNITFNSDVESTIGNVELTVNPLTTSGKVWFKSNVDLDAGDLIVHSAKDFEITGTATIVGDLEQIVGSRDTTFGSGVQAQTITLAADREIRFQDTVTLTVGDMTLVSDDIDFEGGTGSVVGALSAGVPASNLYLRPTAEDVDMDIGDPTGASATFSITVTDIAALADDFASITIGYDAVGVDSTNAVRIGNAAFLDAVAVYGGSFLVNGNFSARTSLLIEADSGLIDVDNTQIRVNNEQLNSVWQSSELNLLAHTGDILLRNGASLLIDNDDPTDTDQGSTINLTATQGSVTKEANSFGFVEARDLNITAADEITLLTNVEKVVAESTVVGAITIDELDGLRVERAVTENGAIAFTSGGDTVVDLIQSNTDAIANTASVSVFGGNLQIDQILAGTMGDVDLEVEGSISGVSALTRPHVVGDLLTITADDGVGAATNPIKILANSVDASNRLSGLVYMQQNAGRDSNTVSVEIENLSATAGDYVALTALGGSVAVTGNGISSASNAGILVDSSDALTIDASVVSQGGVITLDAESASSLGAAVVVDSNGGDVFIDSESDLTMAADASIESLGGAIVVQSGGDVLAGHFDARSADLVDRSTWGAVAIEATGFIHDRSADSTANISANSLKLDAGSGIGQTPTGVSERALEVNAVTIAVRTAGGDLALNHSADVLVGEFSGLVPQVLNTNGTLANGPSIVSLTGVSNTDGGDIVLQSNAAIETEQAIVTSGAGRIVANGDSITFDSAVTSSGGALSIGATNDITLMDAAALATSMTADVLLISDAGSVLGASGSSIASGGSGAVVVSADQNVTLGTVTTTGNVGINATNGFVFTAMGGVDARTVISGDTLSITAGGSVAGVDPLTDALLTDVSTLSLMGVAGAIHRISNTGDLTVGATSAAVTRFDSLLAGTTVTVDSGTDVTVSGAGDIDLSTTVNGNFVLSASSVIETHGAGNIEVESAGVLTMGSASTIENENGTIDLGAVGTAAIAEVVSVDGDITVSSTSGSIIDSDPALPATDFATAGQLDLSASTGIGIEAGVRQTLSVTLGTLSAQSNTGGIFVESATSFATNGISTITSGPVSILSDQALTIGKDLAGVAIDSAADLVVRAGTSLTQEADGTITAAEDVSLFAGTDMLLFSVATPADVALEATGSVMGYVDPTVPAIDAAGLLLDGVGSVGLPTQRLATSVDSLAGTVNSGTLAFDNDSSLTLETVSVSTTAIGPMGLLPVAPSVQSGATLTVNSTVGVGEGLFATVGGDLLVVTAGGANALAVTQPLPVLWQTTGNQDWNGAFDYAGGTATLRSDGSVTIAPTGAIRSDGGDLLVEAANDFTVAGSGAIALTSGDSIINAGENLTVEGTLSTTGSVALDAGDFILAGVAGGATRVTAADLMLTAGDGIGSDTSALTTEVARISSLSRASSAYVDNTGNVRVTNLGFAITSLLPDATFNHAFSGYQGGFQAELSGGIEFNNSGTVQVDPVRATINTFPDSAYELAVLLDEAGPDANALSIIFEVIRDLGDTIDASPGDETPEDLRNGNPATTKFDSVSGVLRVFVLNDVTTMAEIVSAINAEGDFAGSATLVSGPQDGSTVFSIGLNAETSFEAEGGAYEGLVAYDAGTTAGGLDPIAAVAQIQPGDALYTIQVSSTEPGAAANSFTARILDDGPAGRLTDGADEAVVEWNSGTGQLDLFINYGFTTSGTIVDAINAANTDSSVPFTAEFGGSFVEADRDDIIGDPSVLMVSNLSPTALLRPVGADNDFVVTATSPGPLFNGIEFRFIDDGSVDDFGVRAVFDSINNIMSIFVASDVTTANEVITALNTEGTFSATLSPETSGGNNGAGTIQATYFQLQDGAVAVNASITIDMVGGNNDFVITADEPGDDENAIQVVIVGDASITPGAAEATFDPVDLILEITINPDFATAGGIIEAINLGENAASIPLTASLPAGTTGFGGISLVTYPETAGGTGGVARAVVDLEGSENGFEVVADSDSIFLQNIRVFVTDDGSVTDGSASVSYDETTRYLTINLQAGVTTATTVVAAINAATVPVSATPVDGSSGAGTFGDETQAFMGGADPVVASLVTELPSGVVVELESTVGGVVNNGINVSYAQDASLAPDTAVVTLFESDGLRLLQIRAADAATTLNAVQAALDAATDVPFTIANIGAIGALTVGDLAPVSATENEGAIQLTAEDTINLIGRVASETGSVSITTAPAGDLTFDGAMTSIVAIDGIDIDLAGAFVNNASLEQPLLKVYDASLLRVSTGALSASSEAIFADTNGSILLEGVGLSLADSDFTATAANSITVDTAITAASESAMRLEAGEDFVLTVDGSLTADTIYIEATTGTADIAGSAAADTFELVASGDVSQTGTIDTTGALDVTSETGAILMSGGLAASSSVDGDITYDAATNITVTSIVSTNSGDIALNSGESITNSRTSAGTNISTGGEVALTAETGIGLIGDAIRISSGTTELKNLGETGDIVVTEVGAGANLEVTGLMQLSDAGWSIITTEAGNLDFTGAVLHSGTGSLLADSAGGISSGADATITLQGNGELTLTAVSTIDLNADASTVGGDIFIESGGSVTMDALITLSAGGSVAIKATNDVEVAQVSSALASVRIAAANGTIRRAAEDGRINVIAANLQLSAGMAIGGLATEDEALIIEVDRMTATATNGVVAIDSVKDLSVGNLFVGVRLAVADKTTDFEAWFASQLIADAGNVVVQGQGSLTLDTTAGATLDVNGNLLLSSVTGFTANGDVNLSGGSAHLKSGGAFALNGDLDLIGTGTLLIDAGQTFTQAADSTLTTGNLDAVIAATDALTISRVDLDTGDLALTSGGAITRPVAAPATQLDANFIRLDSGANIGSVAEPLVFDAVRVSAAAIGGIRLSGVGAVDVDSVEVIADQVSTLGAADTQRTEAALADIASSSGGDVLLDFGGHVNLRDGNDDARSVATNGDGRLFLSAASIDAYADIRTLNGDLTVDIQGAAHWIATAETSPGADDATAAAALSQTGDIYITTGSNFLMDAATSVRSVSGNIGIDVIGNFTVGSVDAVAGYVHVTASGAILDGGESLSDFIADRLQLEAGTGAGLLGAATYNPLEINANTLSALIANGPLALSEVDSVEIGLTEGTVNKLDVDGVAATALDAADAHYGIESQGGGSVTLVAGGSITALAAPLASPTLAAVRVAGAGELLLDANASGALVVLQGNVDLTDGSLTLRGTGGVSLAAGVTVETGDNGTVNVFSSVGGLTMAEGSTIVADTGDVVVETAGNVLVAGIETSTRVALTSTGGSILDNEAARVNVQASTLRFDANGDFGASTNAFDTQVATVSGRTTDGAVFLEDSAGGLIIGSTEASSDVVGADSEVIVTPVAPLSGIVAGGADGTVVVKLTTGDLTVLAGHVVTAAGSGNILLETPGELDIQAAVSSTSGTISLIATNDILLATAIEVSTGLTGQIFVNAGGALVTGVDSRFVASTGNVSVIAGGNVSLGGIATEGRVAIASLTGYVRGVGSTAFDVEVLGSQLLMSAASGIGTLAGSPSVVEFRTQVGRLSGSAAAGGIHIVNTVGLSVGSVSVISSRVLADGSLFVNPTFSASDLVTFVGPAPIVLRTLDGSITLNDGGDSDGAAVVAAGDSNILISAADELTVNADVLSTSGHIKLSATNTYSQAASATVETAQAGTIYVVSTSGAASMENGALIKAASSVRFEAQGAATLARIEAAAVSVLSATADIQKAAGSSLNVQALAVRLEADAGIGLGVAPISIDGDSLVATTRAGGIFVAEAEGVSVVQNLSVTISEVGADASVTTLSDTALSGLTTEVDGPIVLVAALGNVSVSSGAPVSAATSGPILIETAGLITVSDDISSGSGAISLDAGNGLSLGASVTVSTGAADISLDAGSGVLNQAPTAMVSSGANVRLAATGDVTLTQITGELVSVVTSANILTAPGVATNVTALGLRLDAGLAIGTGAAHLQLAVAELAASALSGGIYLTEQNDITVKAVAVTTTKVTDTAGTSLQTDAALADLRSGNNGQIVLVSQSGSITLDDGDNDGSVVVADGTGSILIDADQDVNANADVTSGNGQIALRAGLDLELSGIDVTTGAGDISLTATTGAITMPANAVVTSTSGAVRASGFTGVSLGQLSGDSVSLVATNGSILGAELSVMNVTANDLRIFANDSIGVASRHIQTSATNATARAVTGAVFLSESSGLNVTSVRVDISEIDSTGAAVSLFDAAQSDVVAGSSVVLNLAAGDLVLEDGNALVDQTSGDGRVSDGYSVRAGGTGGILLQTLNGDLDVNASILAGTGNITARASGAVSVIGSTSIETSGSGDISIEAVQDAITIAAITSVSGEGAIRLAAEGDVKVGIVSGEDVSIASNSGGINGSAGLGLQINATNLRLASNLSVGSSTNFLRTNVAVLSARSTAGSIYISESSTTTVDSVRVEVDEFTSTAGSTTVVDTAQSDVVTLANGDIILVVGTGDLVLNDGSGLVEQIGGDGRALDGVAISAHGTGRILLSSVGALTANANVESATGLVTLSAVGAMNVAAGVDLSTQADVSLSSRAGSILMHGTSTVTASASTLRVDAAGALAIGNLSADSVSLLSVGDVTNASGSTLNVSANSLRIEALASVGVAGLHLSTDLTTLAAQAGGNLFITNLSAITVSGVATSVTEFGSNSATNAVVDAELNDLTAGSNGALVLKTLSGSIEVPNVSAPGTGTVVLDAAAGLTVTGAVDGGSGAVTLVSQSDLIFDAGSSLATTSDASVYLAAVSGAITMAADATLDAANAAVTLRSSGDLTLGQVTGELVSLISTSGALIDLGTNGSTVIADQLRIETSGNVGSSQQVLTVEVDTVAISADSVYLRASGDTIVGTVGGSFERRLGDLTTVTVTDAPISGIVSSGLIDLQTVGGGLELLESAGVLTATGSGSITVAVDGSIIGDAAITSGSGAISVDALGTVILDAEVTSNSGGIDLVAGSDLRIIDGADVTSGSAGNLYFESTTGVIEMNSDTVLSTGSGSIALLASSSVVLGDISTTGAVSITSQNASVTSAGAGTNTLIGGAMSITAESGIGRTGTGTLIVDASSLTLANNTESIYLNSLSEVSLAGLTQNGYGDLYLRQVAGDLTVSGEVLLANGRAVVNVAEDLSVNAQIQIGQDLRIVANTLTMTGGHLISDEGDITIRTKGAASLDATSGMTASSGILRVVSGGSLTVGDLTAGVRVDLRADGSILRSGGEIEAPAVRLYSENGDLGAQLNPLFTNSERIDLYADGSIYISEAGGVELGRSGLNGGGDGTDQNIELNIGAGTFSAISGIYEFDGAGTFVLNAVGALELGTPIRATAGSIAINADSLTDGSADEGLLLEATNGRLSIVATNGIGGAGSADIEISASELTATTVSGDAQVELTGDTRVVGAGIGIQGGSGALSIDSITGALTVDASILHGGSGDATIDLANGDLRVNSIIEQSGAGDLLVSTNNGEILMANVGRINTNSGLMDLFASGNIVLSRIETTSGNISLQSQFESIRRLEGFSGANIVSINRPDIQVAKIAQFTVESGSVTVNGATFFRGSGSSVIFVVLNFG